VPQPDVRSAGSLDQIRDYGTAAATVASLIQREAGLAAFPVTFQFYPNTAAFEKALLDVGYDTALARSTASTMIAVGGHRGVLLNESRLLPMSWGERVSLLAHELGHSLQYELGGGHRGTSDQWLREGFAEWLSIRVLERLERSVSLAAMRRARQSEIRAAGRGNLPHLSDLVTFPQWVNASKRYGATMYGLSLLAADLLVDRHGIGVVLDYFKRFERSDDRVANFAAAFGQEIESFEAELLGSKWRK
jgi:hypothetical protein